MHAQTDKPAVQEALHARFSFFSSDTQQAITASSWASLFPDGNQDHIFKESQKARPDPSRPFWWVDFRDATEEDVGVIAEALSIHPLTAEDIVIREPREKVEVFKNYYLISFQTLASQATEGEQRLGMPSSAVMYILVFQYGVVTFSPSDCSHVRRVRDRMRKMHDPSILSSDWICYALM
jgi:Mg2+ and Co2+ transporter CorA